MATERSRQIVLGVLVIILVVVIVKMWPGTSAAPGPTSNQPGATSAPRQPPAAAVAPAAAAPPAVHLNALNGERPKPEGTERNLFQFKPKAPPAPPPVAAPPTQLIEPAVPAGPPRLPTFTAHSLTFICVC